jgi:hypothetical protein
MERAVVRITAWPLPYRRAITFKGDPMRRILAVAFFACFTALAVQAQLWDKLTNPRVIVTINHPPGFGLTVKQIAFAPVSNASPCAEQFVDAIDNDFTGSGMTVVERQNVESLLNEQRFNLTEFVDPDQKAQLGKMLGPAALVFVKVLRCAPKEEKVYNDYVDYKKVAHRRYISRTSMDFKASVHTVDLTTGRNLTGIPINYSEKRENENIDEGYPEFPSDTELLDAVLAKGVVDAHRMFFQWSEQRELYFFDDEPCALKTAFRMLKAGDQDGALKQSEQNVETCRTMEKVKPKILWHAAYNVGMANFILGRYDEALKHFAEATTAGGGDIVAQSSADCRNAKQLSEQMRRVEERPALEVARKPAEGTATRKTAPSPASAVTASDDAETRLKKLKSMLDKGLITQAEYDRKKGDILKAF